MKKVCDLVNCDLDININKVESYSNKIEKGDMFVAIKGHFVDHLDYLDDAISRGASCVVSDRDVECSIPLIKVDDVNKELISILSKYYDIDLSYFTFIGVTGTDGKTTTTTMISSLINKFEDCCYIGTNGVMIKDEVFPTSNTTPLVEEFFYYLNIIKQKNIKKIIMEVSSEALMHDRISFINFFSGGYTNITGDHLNIHKTIENYIACKMKFCDLITGNVYINKDDSVLKEKTVNNMITYGFSDDCDCVISNYREELKNTFFDITFKNKTYSIESNFLGKYNVYNLCLAFIMLCDIGYDSDSIVENIKDLNGVLGRRQLLNYSDKFDIIVDYAHTINGTLNIMESVVGKYNKIYTVVGSAGGREKEKRSSIGKIVLDNSDIVVFTMDDPRYEDVNVIIDEMIGDYSGDNYVKINDRVDAINYALDNASDNDVVLILGKGNDNYMAIEDKRIPYNDINVVKEYFEKM